jgi:hypothetical protein
LSVITTEVQHPQPMDSGVRITNICTPRSARPSGGDLRQNGGPARVRQDQG